MKFARGIRAISPGDLGFAPWLNLALVLLLTIIILPCFLSQAQMDVMIPKAVTSDAVDKDNIVVVISGENVFFYNDSIITLPELKAVLLQKKSQGLPLLIKADRRASVGRIADIWDLARDLGIEKVDVAAGRGE